MKKKTVQKSVSHKVARSTKSTKSNTTKYLLVLAAILFVLFIFPPTKRPAASVLARTGLFYGSATVTWPAVETAKSYNIYYRKSPNNNNQDADFNYAVRNIPAGTTSYTITHLKRGWTYQYKISAVDASGKEFLWTSFQETPASM